MTPPLPSHCISRSRASSYSRRLTVQLVLCVTDSKNKRRNQHARPNGVKGVKQDHCQQRNAKRNKHCQKQRPRAKQFTRIPIKKMNNLPDDEKSDDLQDPHKQSHASHSLTLHRRSHASQRQSPVEKTPCFLVVCKEPVKVSRLSRNQTARQIPSYSDWINPNCPSRRR